MDIAHAPRAVTYAESSPRARRLALFSAGLLLVLALCVLVGWLSKTPWLLLAFPNAGHTAFNTAALLTLCGIWLMHSTLRPATESGFRQVLACIVIGFCLLVLFEHATKIDLHIDLISLHKWAGSDNPTLGRLAPNTGLSLLLAGLICFLFDFRQGLYRKSLWLTYLRLTLLVIVSISLLGYLLQLEWLYKWFSHSRMALNTSIAMLILTIALFARTQPRFQYDDARKISFFALGILGSTTVVAGLTGFAVFKQAMQVSLAAKIESIADSRTEFLLTEIRQGRQAARSVANNAALQALLGAPGGGRLNMVDLNRDLRDDAIALGLESILILDKQGKPLLRIGVPSEESEVELSIKVPEGSAGLIWSGRALLKVATPIVINGHSAGSVITEEPLPEVEKVFRYTDTMGASGEIKLCSKREDMLECFPSRLVPKVHSVPFYKDGKASYPIAKAILGESGHQDVIDFRGVRVFASHRPVGDTGLGLVAKMDVEEIYAPLRAQGVGLLTLPVLLLLLGAYFMHTRLRPIARRLMDSEAEARGYAADVSLNLVKLETARVKIENRERLLRSITDALPALISYIDGEQKYRYCNHTYLEMFGVNPSEMIGRTVRDFAGEELYAFLQPYILAAFRGETRKFEHTITPKGVTRHIEGRYIPETGEDGEVKGLYLIVWDITESKHRELLLADQANKDALTGLFNRHAILSILAETIQAHYKRRDGLAALFLDIDKFKSINDSLGHAAGDEVLRIFAQRLTATVRGTDFVARLGGDEFVIILSSIASAQLASRVAAKIIAAINAPVVLNGEPRTISTSIGIAYIRNREIKAEDLLAEADAALYEAKGDGRNRYRLRELTGN